MQYTVDELNSSAMQIILHAGNGRQILNEIFDNLESFSDEIIDKKVKEAKNEIIAAHRIQTDIIQSAISNDFMKSTLLFTHAQDTLMSIYSELHLTNNMLRLYRHMKKN